MVAIEDVLRQEREAAVGLVRENRHRVREAIELIVRDDVPSILKSLDLSVETAGTEKLEALYSTMLGVAFNLFALGYTIARSESQRPE